MRIDFEEGIIPVSSIKEICQRSNERVSISFIVDSSNLLIRNAVDVFSPVSSSNRIGEPMLLSIYFLMISSVITITRQLNTLAITSIKRLDGFGITGKSASSIMETVSETSRFCSRSMAWFKLCSRFKYSFSAVSTSRSNLLNSEPIGAYRSKTLSN